MAITDSWRRPRSHLEMPSVSVEQMLAQAERRAGVRPGEAMPERERDGPIIAHGDRLNLLRDLVAVELRAGLGMVGRLFITDATSSTRNQTFTRGRVVSAGPKVTTLAVGDEVLVSGYFGQEVRLLGRQGERVMRVGRLRDIVGVFRPEGLTARTNRVILERLDADNPLKTGGILLPDNVRFPVFRALVLSAGPDSCVKRDDLCLIKQHTFVKVRLDGRELIWIDEPSILCRL